ncbi:unnamed protein product [Rangifer tarandus platyrhynchus]|uniref:Uncharacterized protein n=2 Tax=Rangifer tarandus platyrhynchus TaxID=3082113 RepID=A0ABN8YEA6_RANTA|nr:unnamed protein product [Rangifer tarandus platyrhynchus]
MWEGQAAEQMMQAVLTHYTEHPFPKDVQRFSFNILIISDKVKGPSTSRCMSNRSEVLSEKRTVQGRTSAQGGSEEQTVRSSAGAPGSQTRESGAPAPGARAAGVGLWRAQTREDSGGRTGSARRTHLVMLTPGSRRRRLSRRHQHFSPAPSPHATAAQPAPAPAAGVRAADLIPRSCGPRRGSTPSGCRCRRRRRLRPVLARPAQSRARKWRRVCE